jgi:hypothetical protein
VFTLGLLLLLGIWGTVLIKHWLDERKVKSRLIEEALYLRGKIAGLSITKERDAVQQIRGFNESLGRLKGDSGFIKGMIGYLEKYEQDAEELYAKHKELARIIDEYRRGALLLRQQIIDAGETPPKLSDELERDLDAYNLLLQQTRAEREKERAELLSSATGK